jgi:hypothetical protein
VSCIFRYVLDIPLIFWVSGLCQGEQAKGDVVLDSREKIIEANERFLDAGVAMKRPNEHYV